MGVAIGETEIGFTELAFEGGCQSDLEEGLDALRSSFILTNVPRKYRLPLGIVAPTIHFLASPTIVNLKRRKVFKSF